MKPQIKTIINGKVFEYKDARSLEEILEPFDIVFCHYPYNGVKNTLSLLIRFFQKLRFGPEASVYSHVAIVNKEYDRNGHLRTFIYDANPTVDRHTLQEFIDRNKVTAIEVYRLYLNDIRSYNSNIVYAKSAIINNIGKRYDYVSLLFSNLIYMFTGIWIGTKNSNSFFCSEYVAYVYNILTNAEQFKEWWSVSPAHLYHKVNEYGMRCVGNFYATSEK